MTLAEIAQIPTKRMVTEFVREYHSTLQEGQYINEFRDVFAAFFCTAYITLHTVRIDDLIHVSPPT